MTGKQLNYCLFPILVFFDHIWPLMTSPDLWKWSLTIIYNHWPVYLNQMTHWYSWFTVSSRHWPMISTNCHWSYLIVINHYWLLLTIIDLHWQLFIVIDLHCLPWTAKSLQRQRLPFTTNYWLSSTTIDFH